MAATASGSGSASAMPLVLSLISSASTAGPLGSSVSRSAPSSRIFVNAETLRARKIFAGQPVRLSRVSQQDQHGNKCICGIAWPSFNLAAETVQVSEDADLSLASSSPGSLKNGESVLLESVTNAVAVPSLTLLLHLTSGGATSETPTAPTLESSELQLLLALAKDTLVESGYCQIGHRFVVRLQGINYVLEVSSPPKHDESLSSAVLHITRSCAIEISVASQAQGSEVGAQVNDGSSASKIAYEDVGGLDRQVEEIRELVELPLQRPELFSQYSLRPPKGVLLFGPPGTGKTTLARLAAASIPSATTFIINGPELSSPYHGETEQRLRALFEQARAASPAVIVIDEIDALAPRRDESTTAGAGSGAGEVEKRTVATLLTLLDGIEQGSKGDGNSEDGVKGPARIVVIGATNRPNALDPALRRPGRLDREIEIGIPTAESRAAILRVMLRKVPHLVTDEQIDEIASQTHGYVGADLSSLVREAGMRVIRRVSKGTSEQETAASVSQALGNLSLSDQPGSDATSSHSNDLLQYADLQAAKAQIRPSAMREIVLEAPKVYWSDIVSTDQTQSRVREAVEWPLKHAAAFRRLGIRPPRGVLLYGPPGCSKTMIAQALATESGLNFFAVKGPELYSKYVGESERALRELFRKARAAAPSVIFLDEIDALTTTRGDEGGAVSDRVIATLLTELDGVESATSIVIVAATNRPQVIDPALLRPGRLDRLLYVSPPDVVARRRLLELQTGKMAVAAGDLNLDALADLTEGCSGAEIMSVCQEAGMMALAESVDAEKIRQDHFEQAARSVRRRISPAMLGSYEAWRNQQNV
ncbi:AAA+-type ATPase [Tilletia horrida]|uniref:AAA+-type ATPase n=1 Tax=Tilletia horrida TaxID=155126 RepID=A0AAN6GT55_9BASI|nr:AAA+-type ATPase [Tilletia horrida]KAK0556432.1 AAA+-type ATPase [Tilletia horrida]KAK0569362.1 AAA+-type ATPase [Tilletia horrida]